MGIFCITKKMFFTYLITVCMSCTTEGIGAVVVVVDEVAFGSGEFKVGAILA